MKPYYQDSLVTLYHGDWREAVDDLRDAEAAITDPPYGRQYRTNANRDPVVGLARSIEGDADTTERDAFLEAFGDTPALVFGSWKVARPARCHTLLIWDTKGALGMGNLSVPWKPAHQEIYVCGYGFRGPRDTDVLSFAPVQAMARNGRVHPHEKPVALLMHLLQKVPSTWTVADPFAGSGSLLDAARRLGRKAIGCEKVERYCEIAAERCRQEVLDLGA